VSEAPLSETVADADLTDMLRGAMPLCGTLGIVGVSATPDRVEVAMDVTHDVSTSGGLVHGGAVMAIADSAGAVVAAMNLPAGATGTSTIESKTNFLGGASTGMIRAVATPLHVGSTTIVVETEIRSDDRLIAKVTQTQAVLRQRA